VRLPTPVPRAPAFRAVIEQIGFASGFQETHGYYADAVGLATVVLPTGWQERLVPLVDGAGILRAHCLEVHDTCVNKLMAGREKDFVSIKELLDRGLVNMETFIERARPVAGMPHDVRPRSAVVEAHPPGLQRTRGRAFQLNVREVSNAEVSD
jgi:hypothetical protein